MTSVAIRAGSTEYHALIGSGLLSQVGIPIAERLAASRSGAICAIISDANVALPFGERLKSSLTNAGFRPALIIVPAGEQSKTLEQVGEICHQMIAVGLDRQSFVIGLGGGVIGDISGFVAAIFQRGIRHVQIPTTLLAMVDSSIGGKTGVNTEAGKNLLGAVHQPALVIDDVELLKTLPPREFKQGFAEIIKHAIIADAKMFRDLSQLAPSELDCFKQSSLSGADSLISLVRRNIEIKSRIVAKDELDRTGDRAVLNFGHTIGHGIERAGRYRQFLHGEAVALGTAAAAAISVKKAGLPKSDRNAIIDILNHFELPTRLPEDFPRDRITEALKFDKKFEAGEIRFVLTRAIGSAYVSSDVTMEDIREAIAEL